MSVLRSAVCATALVAGLSAPGAAAKATVCDESIALQSGNANLIGEVSAVVVTGSPPFLFVVGVRVVGHYRTSEGRMITIECFAYDILG